MYEDTLKASFTKYINVVIKNTARNYFKRKRYRQNREIDVNEFEDVLLSNDNGTIFLSKEDITDEKIEKIFSNFNYYNAMKSLTSRQKLVLYLNAVENYSDEEIAKILNVNAIIIRTKLYKAKNKFKENLKKGK